MAETFNGFTVTESNGSLKSGQRASVIVRNSSGQVCARVKADKGKLLQRMRRELLSEERKEIISQLKQTGVPDDVINDMLSLRKSLTPTS